MSSPLFCWRDAVLSDDEQNTLTPTQRLVALALSMNMNTQTLQARPGVALLARRSGLSQRSVKTALADLVAAGWLKQTRKGGTRKGGTPIASEYEGARCSTCTSAGDSPVRPVQEVHGTRAPRSKTSARGAHQLDRDLDRGLEVSVNAFELDDDGFAVRVVS